MGKRGKHICEKCGKSFASQIGLDLHQATMGHWR